GRSYTRLTRRRFLGASATAAAGLALYACGPGQSTQQSAPGAAPATPDRSAQATVAMGTGAGQIKGIPEINGLTAIHHPEVWWVAHSSLSQYDHDYNHIATMAERLPSLDDGTWIVNPDGTM